jgi:hypothetical protein
MTVAELLAKLSTLPREWPVVILDNNTGDCLDLEDADTAEAMDLDCADEPAGNRLVIVRAKD